MNNDSPTLLTAEMALHLAEMMELSEEYNGMDADERRFSKALRSLASGKTECRVVGTDEVEPFVVRHYTSDERPTIKGNGFDGLEVGETREDAETFVAWLNAALRGRVVGAVPADVEAALALVNRLTFRAADAGSTAASWEDLRTIRALSLIHN